MVGKYATRQSLKAKSVRRQPLTQDGENSSKRQKVSQNTYFYDSIDQENESSSISDSELLRPVAQIGKIFACRFRKKTKPDESTVQLASQESFSSSKEETTSDAAKSSINLMKLAIEKDFMYVNELQKEEFLTAENVFHTDQREMEYLVQLEGDSHRKLTWFTKTELTDLAEDQADTKINLFHRRFTDNQYNVEYLLPERIWTNIEFLYTKIERVIGLRIKNRRPRASYKSCPKLFSESDKEYLVKWNMLTYSQCTWEPAVELLKNPEDLEAINHFKKVNKSFKFPSFRLSKTGSKAVNDENHMVAQKVEGEDYTCAVDDSTHLSSNLWKQFLRYKLSDDGLYCPSENRFLMTHQQNGLKWLFHNVEVEKHGSLLADEMGLGKTCQSIVFLEHLLDCYPSKRCHALVVVQKSVLENWKREFQTWTPHLNVITLYGSREDRQLIKTYEIPWFCPESGVAVKPLSNTNNSRVKIMKPDVILLTYEGLRSSEFKEILNRFQHSSKWTCVIVDECQKVKSGKSSVLLQTLQQIKTETMVLLTGTPIQNSTEELFPMFTLLDPKKFTYDEHKTESSNVWTASKFYKKFSDIQKKENCMELTEELHTLMSPYILRREKYSVLKTLPSKTIKLIKIPLTLVQKRVYSALYHKSIWTRGIKFSNIHMQLRKCCIHPFLIEGIESLVMQGKIDTNPINSDAEPQNSEALETREERVKRLILETSGKMILLKKMLELFQSQNRKVLIFSYFKNALDIIEDFIELYAYGWLTERVDGDTNANERQLAIDRFNLNPKKFIFLCTTKAGGVGINLTSATVVIHLDSDFNPQNDLQAQARCHRIGQSKHVDIFYFIAEHTYEDYMVFNIAGKKLGLEAVLLGRLNSNLRLNKIQEETVLRKGIFAAIRDDDVVQKDAKEFAQSSIDSILHTKSVTLMYDDFNSLNKNVFGDPKEKPCQLKGESSDVSNNEENISLISNDILGDMPLEPESDSDILENQVNDETDISGLDQHLPDFWIRAAQRLQPFSIDEQKPKELNRADRRRGRNINYRNDIYQHSNLNRSDDEEDEEDDDYGDEDEEEDTEECVFQLGDESRKDTDCFFISTHDKRDFEKTQALRNKTYKNDDFGEMSNGSSAESTDFKSDNKKRIKLSLNEGISNLEPLLSIEEQNRFWDEYIPSLLDTENDSIIEISTILQLLYRCLRCCEKWKNIRTENTIGFRTDDIRSIDRLAPWARHIYYFNTSASDYNLPQSWKIVLEEWNQAGIDWRAKENEVLKKWCKYVLDKRKNSSKEQWAKKILPNLDLSTNFCSNSEIHNITLMKYGSQILQELQTVCDELAAKVLVGRYFSRQFTLKKQTWIAAENLCIKFLFTHLIAFQYKQQPKPITKVMIWPLSNSEVNWSIVTEVIKRFNKYTNGAERRKVAIKERFYNKLDSRWNHNSFSPEEKNILATAYSNNIQPFNVAEKLPGRTLERVKKGLRFPDIVRLSQVNPTVFEPNCNIVNSFNKYCESYLMSFFKDLPESEKKAIIAQQQGYPPLPLYSSENSKMCHSGFFDCLPNAPDAELLGKIQEILAMFSVEQESLKKLQSTLSTQSVNTLTELLKQLKLLSLCHKPHVNPLIRSVFSSGIKDFFAVANNKKCFNLTNYPSKIVQSHPPQTLNESKTSQKSITSQFRSLITETNLLPSTQNFPSQETNVLKSEIVSLLNCNKLDSNLLIANTFRDLKTPTLSVRENIIHGKNFKNNFFKPNAISMSTPSSSKANS